MDKLNILWDTDYSDWILSILICYNIVKSIYESDGSDFKIWTSVDYFCINIINCTIILSKEDERSITRKQIPVVSPFAHTLNED